MNRLKKRRKKRAMRASSAPKLVLHFDNTHDRDAYQRLVASAADEPRSSVPMGGRCCGKRHKKTKTSM